jgi:hypothetical protein
MKAVTTQDLVCGWNASPILRDRPVERLLPDAGIALTSECFWPTVTATRAGRK